MLTRDRPVCLGAASYTLTYNALNFTAGSVPVTAVTEDDLRKMTDYVTPDPSHSIAKKVVFISECFLCKEFVIFRYNPYIFILL